MPDQVVALLTALFPTGIPVERIGEVVDAIRRTSPQPLDVQYQAGQLGLVHRAQLEAQKQMQQVQNGRAQLRAFDAFAQDITGPQPTRLASPEQLRALADDGPASLGEAIIAAVRNAGTAGSSRNQLTRELGSQYYRSQIRAAVDVLTKAGSLRATKGRLFVK